LNDRPIDTVRFGPTLVAWQRTHGRHALPWQQLGTERDPYRVWIAEIMLQQTQVAAVIPFYRRFLDRFPDVSALAYASLDDVMRHWSGLGYYSRARHLHAAARRIVVDFGGVFPVDPAVLESLPGLGRSTAAAIAVFAFGRRAAILDGNVKRVLARVFAIEGVPATAATTKALWRLADALLPARDIERYTQGLMDLGATLCTPRNPSCLLCPFKHDCLAHREGRVAELPHRARRKLLPERRVTMLLVTRGDAVLLERRPPIGIWGGLWSLPETTPVDDVEELGPCVERYGEVVSLESGVGFTHGFTHFVLHADVVHARVREPASGEQATRIESPAEAVRWVRRADVLELGLPAPIRTLMLARA
jgi:A/G-specific adenine glycosylase